ncbi:hypothetical protein SARC_02952 [Sphaeroforma arctica JP610]|uniref:Expansin-like EG45 domain-containing protein n=1 Tax=Sphaeroforma arctica JP610 TaxID=667725 RepID=A0A0L0G7I2_9EUKA|nr:hypothetical protein SARC_02952 [Sphaeroforma arctica JP610]KNC84841.1 hypothetical protein SARC_02952 [Sphaeroforma arctica JP610]|eukprot:XP_014158743.1 hypothetical protein SARC_02952 [Sphaeroforma arctica JP610]
MRSHVVFDQEHLTAGTCGNTDVFYPGGKRKVVSVAYGSFAYGENCGTCIDVRSAQGVRRTLTVFESFNAVNGNELEVSESLMEEFSKSPSGVSDVLDLLL